MKANEIGLLTGFRNYRFHGRRMQVGQINLDLARIRAYVVSGRVDRALAVAKQVPQDVTHQREVAALLQMSQAPAALEAAKSGWQQVQAATPAGSTEWMAARLNEVEVHLALNDASRKVDEAMQKNVGGMLGGKIPGF